MLKDFKAFLMRPNILDLAIAFMLASFFGAVVTALINGVVLPLIAATVGQPNFDALIKHVGKGDILYGTFLTAVVNFLIVGSVLFVFAKAAGRLKSTDEATTRACPFCKTDIALDATRCPHCTSELAGV
jgi:large conductance mechanosensitive channel